MSRTTLYGADAQGTLRVLGEYSNSSRSLPMICDYLVVKLGYGTRDEYLNPKWDKIWQEEAVERMTEDKWFVLASVFDRGVFPRALAPRLVQAMRTLQPLIIEDQPSGYCPPSFAEQADDIEKNLDDTFFCWNQTSVCCAWPQVPVHYEKYDDSCGCCDCASDDDHRMPNVVIDGGLVLIEGYRDVVSIPPKHRWAGFQ